MFLGAVKAIEFIFAIPVLFSGIVTVVAMPYTHSERLIRFFIASLMVFCIVVAILFGINFLNPKEFSSHLAETINKISPTDYLFAVTSVILASFIALWHIVHE